MEWIYDIRENRVRINGAPGNNEDRLHLWKMRVRLNGEPVQCFAASPDRVLVPLRDSLGRLVTHRNSHCDCDPDLLTSSKEMSHIVTEVLHGDVTIRDQSLESSFKEAIEAK
jgi:hypothetical protein